MKDNLKLYKIDPEYLSFLHSIDNRISVKYNNRPFVGIVTMVNDIPYVLPLTSQTTQKRKEEGKNKRSSMLTTFVKDGTDVEIANILHNNMFPVKEGSYTALEIDPAVDTYESNEIRYIRKHKEEIVNKAIKVYMKRTTKANDFLKKACCDFKNLEEHYKEYKK